MDPKTLLEFVPVYSGDAQSLYHFLNTSRQWLEHVGATPENVMLLLGRLREKAAQSVSMIEHNFQWNKIEKTLKNECGDNREFNTLLIELMNFKRRGSYSDFIHGIKQKLFFIKSKYSDDYNDEIIDVLMKPYIDVAQNVLRNSLPYHDQIYISNCGFTESVNKILQLEAEGRFDNIKQKFANILPTPKLINNPVSMKPNFSTYTPIAHYSKDVYPPTPRSFNQQHTQNNYHQRHPWKPNPNNIFSKPQHEYFRQNNNQVRNNFQHRNMNTSEDVSMRTSSNRNKIRPGQIPLGRNMVAEEVFHNYEDTDSSHNEGYQYPHEYNEFIENEYLEELNRKAQNFQKDQVEEKDL